MDKEFSMRQPREDFVPPSSIVRLASGANYLQAFTHDTSVEELEKELDRVAEESERIINGR